ncbi:hypothetical protein ACI3PH_04910 [Lactococcus lactis]
MKNILMLALITSTPLKIGKILFIAKPPNAYWNRTISITPQP